MKHDVCLMFENLYLFVTIHVHEEYYEMNNSLQFMHGSRTPNEVGMCTTTQADIAVIISYCCRYNASSCTTVCITGRIK